jgi:hypothetical protein
MNIEALKNVKGLEKATDETLQAVIKLYEKSSKILVEGEVEKAENAIKTDINGKLEKIENGLTIDTISSIGDKVKNAATLQSNLDDLQSKYDKLKKEGSTDEALKTEIDELKGTLKTLKKTHKDYVTTSENALKKKDDDHAIALQKSELSGALVGIEFNDTAEDLRNLKLSTEKEKFFSTFRKENRSGTDVYVDIETGKVQYDEKTFEPKTAKELFLPMISSIVSQGGGGTGSGAGDEGKLKFQDVDLIGVKTKDEGFNAYSQALNESGIKQGTEDYGVKMEEFMNSDEYAALT